MNLMFYLNQFEDKIKSLSFYQKAQLYLIPLLISVFSIYNFIDFSKNDVQKPKEILESNRVDIYAFLNELQEFANKHNLEILKTQQASKFLDLEIKGVLPDLLKVLYFCETYKSVNKIDNLQIDMHNGTVTLDFKLEFATHKYNFARVDLNSIKQITQNNNQTKIVAKKEDKAKKTEKEELQLKLTAIVNNTALLNNTWIKKGDFIGEYKVLNINMHSVILLNNIKQKIVLHINKGRL